MGREFELKYAATPEILEKLRELYRPFTEISMETTYYDTRDLSLRKKKWMLRRRMENGMSVCTLKTPLPDGSRGEWEVSCPDIEEALPLLCASGAPKELEELTPYSLSALCGAKFTRLAATVKTDDGTAELALDKGFLLAGDNRLALCEVEVELKSGSDSAAEAFAQTLADTFDLKKEKKSKVQRAMSLAFPTGETP